MKKIFLALSLAVLTIFNSNAKEETSEICNTNSNSFTKNHGLEIIKIKPVLKEQEQFETDNVYFGIEKLPATELYSQLFHGRLIPVEVSLKNFSNETKIINLHRPFKNFPSICVTFDQFDYIKPNEVFFLDLLMNPEDIYNIENNKILPELDLINLEDLKN